MNELIYINPGDEKLYYPCGSINGRLHFGFVNAEAVAADKRLRIPELNSGFIIEGNFESEQPVIFKAEVPEEGIYKVTLEIYAGREADNALVFIGRRRLALKRDFKAQETFTGSFLTHICPVIPRGYSEVMEDRTLDIALAGDGLELRKVSAERVNDVKVIYIAGDSTVTDQSAGCPYNPAESYSGWGQMLSCFTGTDAVVSNHAHSGLTTISMRSEGHFGIIEERIGKGDICLFQFGHNDQKLSELKAREGYKEKLNAYVDEMLEKGAVPVIVSPLARNTWKNEADNTDGTPAIVYNDLLEEYAYVCEELAGERGIPYIDLHGYAMDLIKAKGRDDVKCYFYPSDYTHTNDYGAYRFAGFIYSEMVRLGLINDNGLPAEWEPKSVFAVKEEAGSGQKNTAGTVKNAPIRSVTNPETAKVEIDRPEDFLTRAEAFELAVKTMKFFPTNVYNDMFDDIVGHETYAGTVQCAYQNGFIPEGMAADRKIEPGKYITCEELFAILELAYSCRKPNTEEITKLKVYAPGPKEPITRGSAAKICAQINV